MIAAQTIAAHEASMHLLQLAWHPDQSFVVQTRYLELAEKAARTMAMLTERLDQHRGRGQQQIIVKHVTVNADQAVITETVATQGVAAQVLPMTFVDLGLQQVKNIQDPVRAYQVSAPSEAQEAAPERVAEAESPPPLPTSLPLRFCGFRTCPVIQSRSILRMAWLRKSPLRSRGLNGYSWSLAIRALPTRARR
jgi:hypothetical protein